MKYQMPELTLAKINVEIADAIQKGLDHAEAKWKIRALMEIYDIAASSEYFSVNDFRKALRALPYQTHDNRAVGGLITTAKRYGWITRTEETTGSLVAHLVPVRVWKSLIYQRVPIRAEQGTLY